MKKIFVVQEVDYDGHRIGRCYRMALCETMTGVEKMIKAFTLPVVYHDGTRKFMKHTHNGKQGSIEGYLGPLPTFVYFTTADLHE